MQGNPNSSEYEKHTPFMANGSLTWNPHKQSNQIRPSALRPLFNIENTRNKDAPKYSTFKVVCMVPDGPRWSNFRTPSHGSLMQASGDWMGYYEVDGVCCPCIVATAFSFIRTANSPISPWLPEDGECCCPECLREYPGNL
jgi:hypothetical protein